MVGFLEDMVLDRQRDMGQPQLSICTFKGKAMPTNDVAAEEKRQEVISETSPDSLPGDQANSAVLSPRVPCDQS